MINTAEDVIWAVETGNVDIHEKNSFNGMGTLHNTVLAGRMDVVVELIRHGVDVEQTDHDMRTPLMFAARDQKTDMIDVFHAAGADINMTDRHGNTALHYCASSKQASEDAIVRLIELGASQDLRNNQGMTPEDVGGANTHEIFQGYRNREQRTVLVTELQEVEGERQRPRRKL